VLLLRRLLRLQTRLLRLQLLLLSSFAREADIALYGALSRSF
jgi:hypothetical protein